MRVIPNKMSNSKSNYISSFTLVVPEDASFKIALVLCWWRSKRDPCTAELLTKTLRFRVVRPDGIYLVRFRLYRTSHEGTRTRPRLWGIVMELCRIHIVDHGET
jgi:hypothetical protein